MVSDNAVDVIRNEQDRLSLSYDQLWYIPPRLWECSHLRSLSIRSNIFGDIPGAIYNLPALEILDVSQYKI